MSSSSQFIPFTGACYHLGQGPRSSSISEVRAPINNNHSENNNHSVLSLEKQEVSTLNFSLRSILTCIPILGCIMTVINDKWITEQEGKINLSVLNERVEWLKTAFQVARFDVVRVVATLIFGTCFCILSCIYFPLLIPGGILLGSVVIDAIIIQKYNKLTEYRTELNQISPHQESR